MTKSQSLRTLTNTFNTKNFGPLAPLRLNSILGIQCPAKHKLFSLLLKIIKHNLRFGIPNDLCQFFV